MLVVHDTAVLRFGTPVRHVPQRDQLGVTLIEIMVGLVITGILFALAAPSFRDWLQDAQIRTLAESMLNGLQVAKSTAVSRNTAIGFYLTTNLNATCALSATGTNWVVSEQDPTAQCANASTVAPFIIQSHTSIEGSPNAAVSSVAAVSGIAFNGLGQASGVNGSGQVSAATFNVSNPTGGTCKVNGGNMHCMQIDVTPGGRVRMCDPSLANTDPQGCP